MRIPVLVFAVLHLISNSANAQDDVVDELTYKQSSIYLDQGWQSVTGKDYDGALEKFNKSIELYDGNADAYVGRANAFSMLGELDRAEGDIKTALEMTGEESDMLYLAGNVFFKMEKFHEARDYYTKALANNEASEVKIDSSHCFYNRANAYFEEGLYRSAINDFTRTIQMDEGFKNAYHNRGLAYAHRDLLEEACADFDVAITLGSKITQKFKDKYCK